jgi:hypothetical protein
MNPRENLESIADHWNLCEEESTRGVYSVRRVTDAGACYQ